MLERKNINRGIEKIDLMALYDVFESMLDIIEKKKRELEELINELDGKIELLKEMHKVEVVSQNNSFEDNPKAQLIIKKMLTGKTARDIALEEGLHQGEVELIMNLYKARYANSSDS